MPIVLILIVLVIRYVVNSGGNRSLLRTIHLYCSFKIPVVHPVPSRAGQVLALILVHDSGDVGPAPGLGTQKSAPSPGLMGMLKQ